MMVACTEAIEQAAAAKQDQSSMPEPQAKAIDSMGPEAKKLFETLDRRGRGRFMRSTLITATADSPAAMKKGLESLVPDDDGDVTAVAFHEWVEAQWCFVTQARTHPDLAGSVP